MERKKFLKNIALSASSLSLLLTAFKKTNSKEPGTTECGVPVTPAVNEGPFYINEKLNRSNLAESKPGIPLTLVFTVEDIHCKPIKDAIVDIWHCDTEGVYSDEGHEGTAGQKWMRGYQLTDSNGKCIFQTIFPGWYDGRITHIHGKVRVGNVTKQTTNFFIPKHIEKEVYSTPHYKKGQNPVTVKQDIELKGDSKRYNELMMSVTGDVKKGYVATYTIAFV